MRHILIIMCAMLACMMLLTPTFATQVVVVGHNNGTHKVVIANAMVPLFDPNAFAFFTFYGPVAINPSPTLGIDAYGRELKLATPQDVERANNLKQQQPQTQSQGQVKLASLTNSCSSCHSEGGRLRGGFALFDTGGNIKAGTDWKKVLEEIKSGSMPPPNSGKPAVLAEDLAEITKLVGK